MQIYGFYRILIDSMKIKQTIMTFALLVGFGAFFVAPVASAIECGGVTTSIINCDGYNDNSKVETSGVWGILMLVLNILTGAAGIAAAGGIIYGSIIYTTAGGSVDKVKQARVIITNTVIGIVAYALMYSFLNYIIPGGVF